MEYSINDNTFTLPSSIGSVPLTVMGANIWQGNLIIPTFGSSDTVYWRFIANDTGENLTFFGGETPYTDGYPGGPVSSYFFSLTTPCMAY